MHGVFDETEIKVFIILQYILHFLTIKLIQLKDKLLNNLSKV